jgi:uncharacterized membrane protein YvbJ
MSFTKVALKNEITAQGSKRREISMKRNIFLIIFILILISIIALQLNAQQTHPAQQNLLLHKIRNRV